MRKLLYFLLGVMLAVSITAPSDGAEHGGVTVGSEHPQKAEPSAGDIREAINDYIKKESARTQRLDIYDGEAGKMRSLKFIRVHERVGKSGNYYYSCADFEDSATAEMLDLDFDVREKYGKLVVVEVRIHKVAGKERYTYDEKDNRIPVKK